jgi:hypothetical protein
LNEDARDLRIGLWGVFEVIRRDRDFGDRWRERYERACVMIGGNRDHVRCHIDGSTVLSSEIISPRAKDRRAVAVDWDNAIVVRNVEHGAWRRGWDHDVSHRNGEAVGRDEPETG